MPLIILMMSVPSLTRITPLPRGPALLFVFKLCRLQQVKSTVRDVLLPPVRYKKRPVKPMRLLRVQKGATLDHLPRPLVSGVVRLQRRLRADVQVQQEVTFIHIEVQRGHRFVAVVEVTVHDGGAVPRFGVGCRQYALEFRLHESHVPLPVGEEERAGEPVPVLAQTNVDLRPFRYLFLGGEAVQFHHQVQGRVVVLVEGENAGHT